MINRWTFCRLLHLGFFVVAMSQAVLAEDAQQEDEAPASITLTSPDGSKTTLLPDTIRRIRKAISPEAQSGARTRIDWLQVLLVRESPEDVAAMVEQSVSSLAKLRLPEGSPIWFKSKIAQGPVPLTRDQLKDGVRSAVYLGDNLQFLGSTPEEVRQELSDKGGNALPEPQAIASVSPRFQKASKPAQEPEAQAPQLVQPEPEQTRLAGGSTQPKEAQAEQTPQLIEPQPEQAQQVDEIIRPQQAQAEQAPQLIQPQPEQAQQAGEIIRLQQAQAEQAPQLIQPQPEQAQQMSEIIRLQQTQTEQGPQLIQPQPEQARQMGEIIRLQQTQAEQAPPLIEPQPEQAQQMGEIIRLQQTQAEQAPQLIRPQPEQAQQVGEIIRLQQTQAEQAPQLIQAQPEQAQQVGEIIRLQEAEAEPMEQTIRASAGRAGAAVLQAGRTAAGVVEWILRVR
jgi:hypothetical protein